jgi:hypothetical protein
MLQAGRSHVLFPMRSLVFSFDLILPVAVWVKGGQSARKADSLTAICEPIVYKMWEPRPLTTVWALTAWYRHSFTLLDYSSTTLDGRYQKAG